MWMNLENTVLNAISQTEKDRYFITYMWNLKNYAKQRQTYRCRKRTSFHEPREVRRDKLGVWD